MDVSCPGSSNLSCPVIGQSTVFSLIDLRDGCVMPWFRQFIMPCDWSEQCFKPDWSKRCVMPWLKQFIMPCDWSEPCFKPDWSERCVIPGSGKLSCPVIGQNNVLSLIDLRDGCVMPWLKQFIMPVIGQSNVLSLIDLRDGCVMPWFKQFLMPCDWSEHSSDCSNKCAVIGTRKVSCPENYSNMKTSPLICLSNLSCSMIASLLLLSH